MRFAIVALLCFLQTAAWPGRAWASDERVPPRIVTIDERSEGTAPGRLGRGLQERQLLKFMEELERPGRQQVDVRWDATQGGVPGPVRVRMLYRHEGSRDVRNMVVDYPDGAQGEQVARFTISESVIQREGVMTAWRIQLIQGRRVLDDRTSAGWR